AGRGCHRRADSRLAGDSGATAERMAVEILRARTVRSAAEAALLAGGVASRARHPVLRAQVAGLAALGDAIAAPLDAAVGRATVARRLVAVVALLTRLEDVVTALHEETDGVAPVARGAVQRPVVALFARADVTVAAPCDLAVVVARIARGAVQHAVVAGLARVDDAVAASGLGAVRIAAVPLDEVPVVTLLAALHPAVAARLDLAGVRAAVAVVGVAVVAVLAALQDAVAAHRDDGTAARRERRILHRRGRGRDRGMARVRDV